MLTFGSVVPLVALLAVTTTGVKGDHPGFKARVTQHALDYANQQVMDALAVHVPRTNIPVYSGRSGSVNYWLSDIRITWFDRPSSNIGLVPGTGLSWSVTNADVSFSANWRLTYKLLWFTIPASGTLVASANGITFHTTVALGMDSEGRPSIQSAGCSSSVSSVNIRFHNRLIAWVLNIFRGRIERRVEEIIPDKLCEAVRGQIYNVQRKLQQLPVVIPVEEFLLDFRLLSAPVIQRAYIETFNKGEITSSADPQSPPFSPRALPPYPSANKMLYLWVGEYVSKSFFYAAQENGYLQYNIIAEDLHPDHRGFLDTTCTGIACVGHLIPAIGERYPENTLGLRISSTSTPQVTMMPGHLTAELAGDIALYVNTPHGLASYIATLNVSAIINMTATIVNQAAVGNISGCSVSVGVVDSAIGQVNGQVINTRINAVLQSFIIPMLNEAGNRGFPLPAAGKVRFANTQLQIRQNALMVGTDLRYNLLQNS